jgi:hypothetical protein
MPEQPANDHQPEEGDLGAVPGFRNLSPNDPLINPILSDLDPSGTPDQPTTSTQNPPPPDEPTRPPKTPPSSPTSIDPEVDEALAGLGAGAFHVLGVMVNKAAQRRNHSNTRLWLATEDEANAFGDALGRIAARRVPEELADGDGADLLVMGSVALGYGIRNGMGVADNDPRLTGEAPPAPAHSSESPAPAPPPPERRTMVQPVQQGPMDIVQTPPASSYGAEPASPPPPDVIDPGI